MHAMRTPSLLAALALIAGILAIGVGSVTAATCTLTAPTTAEIGSVLTIEASGFPASSAVDVSITLEGHDPDEFTTQTDATGGFQINLQPEAADRGVTTIVASAGAGCSAQVVIAVGIPAPESSDGAVAGSAPPTTDSEPVIARQQGTPGATVWLALILLVVGISGLALTRPTRSR